MALVTWAGKKVLYKVIGTKQQRDIKRYAPRVAAIKHDNRFLIAMQPGVHSLTGHRILRAFATAIQPAERRNAYNLICVRLL